MSEQNIIDITAVAYLIAGVLFILALRGLSSPESSRKGNVRHARYGDCRDNHTRKP